MSQSIGLLWPRRWKLRDADSASTGLLCFAWGPSFLPTSRHDRSSLVDMAEPETACKAKRNFWRHLDGRLSGPGEQARDSGGQHFVWRAGSNAQAQGRTRHHGRAVLLHLCLAVLSRYLVPSHRFEVVQELFLVFLLFIFDPSMRRRI